MERFPLVPVLHVRLSTGVDGDGRKATELQAVDPVDGSALSSSSSSSSPLSSWLRMAGLCGELTLSVRGAEDADAEDVRSALSGRSRSGAADAGGRTAQCSAAAAAH